MSRFASREVKKITFLKILQVFRKLCNFNICLRSHDDDTFEVLSETSDDDCGSCAKWEDSLDLKSNIYMGSGKYVLK